MIINIIEGVRELVVISVIILLGYMCTHHMVHVHRVLSY